MLQDIWYFPIIFPDSPVISVYFTLFCPINISFLAAHSHLLNSSFTLAFVICGSLFDVLSFPSGNCLSLNPCPILFFTHFSPHHWGDLLPSAGSSNAVSSAGAMRRSTTAPTWGSNPRRWRSRHQSYKLKVLLWPALPSSSPSKR